MWAQETQPTSCVMLWVTTLTLLKHHNLKFQKLLRDYEDNYSGNAGNMGNFVSLGHERLRGKSKQAERGKP